MDNLLQSSVKAHGGLERWNKVKAIKVAASITGAIWFVKSRGDYLRDVVPEFPLAAAALGPLRSNSESAGSGDFTSLWSCQAARLARELPAAELTKRLAAEILERLRWL
jgi:hypothetical protein